MFIHWKELATKGVLKLEGQEDLTSLLPTDGSLTGFGPLHVQLEARDVEGAAVVYGNLEIDVELSCSRCLTAVRDHVEIPFHETFVKGEENAANDSDEEDEEEDDVLYVSGDRIELAPFLAESVMFSLPYIPLCKEDCKGLCPSCGTDRNEKECGCRTDKIDPRLAGLADLFKNE
ncbi:MULTISPECIES: DUF177 domain-containing protein [unclassified Paenibacillus]|uniref:YceD family protein n=1 Tax=unclassified Paenibacillus TaxID=185978 RepID=UPI0009308773|nr:MULTISPECIES: DUF177 domain-containing protein [unclassified Paenibacillus]